MQIHLFVEPRTPPMDFETFVASKPPFGIALDGYVAGPPAMDFQTPHASFNHHEGVPRLETRATCAQVHILLRKGLYRRFQVKGQPRADLYVNDCDEDVCLSVFLLENPHLVTHSMNPLINRLVNMEDFMDATAGTYPYPPELPMLAEMAWVFAPYRRVRQEGLLSSRDPDLFRGVITDVSRRIMAHLVGKGESIELDTRYEVIRPGTGWSMVRELGGQARAQMAADGIDAFVTVMGQSDGGTWTYAMGRGTQFVPLDIPLALERLNKAELAAGGDPEDPWGGSPLAAGSPRAGGSRLDPDTVFDIVEQVAREGPIWAE